MDLNLHKNTGDKLAASEINQITEAVNSKLDRIEFKTINGETITGNGEIKIEIDVDLSGYLTTTGATNVFQPKGNYLIESDVIGKYIPTGTTFSYNNLSNLPTIPSITGLASEGFVLNSLTGKSNVSDVYSKIEIDSKAFLTGVTYSEITGRPTIPDSYSKVISDSKYLLTGTTFSYLDLSNKPSIPSITGLASESFVLNNLTGKSNASDVYTKTQIDSKAFLTGVTYAQVSGKPTFSTVATSGSYIDLSNKPDLSAKADLVSGKVPVTQLPDATLNSLQFETLPDGSIGIRTSYLQSLGLGGTGNTIPTLTAPTGFNISGATASALTISWSTVANATSYQVERANSASFTGSTTVYTGSTLTFNNTGLTASTNYYYRVKAKAANYNDSAYALATGATIAGSTGTTNYMTGFVPVMVLSGLTSGKIDTSTSGSTVYLQGATTNFNSTQNYHIPASSGGEIAVKIVDLTSDVSFGLVDNYQLSNPYGVQVADNKVYQKNGSQTFEIVGQTVAVGDFIIVKTYDDNTGGGDNNALRYYKIFKSSDGGATRTELVLPEGSNYNNSTTKFISFTNGNPSRLAYPQMKGAVAG